MSKKQTPAGNEVMAVDGVDLLQRASDLVEKCQMPWSDAERLALNEIGIGEAEIAELQGECCSSIILTGDDISAYTRAILVHGCRLTRQSGALAELAEVKVGGQAGAEELAECFIAAEIDRAPEPMRRLGEYLASALDEDQFKAASRMLLGAIEVAAHAKNPVPVSQSARQPLTDDQIYALFPRPHKDAMTRRMEGNIARAVEAAHGIKA